jgi:hypothetical protein
MASIQGKDREFPFLYSSAARTASGPISSLLVTPAPGVNWLEHETDHSSSSSAEVKNDWSCISTPHTFSRISLYFLHLVTCLLHLTNVIVKITRK